MAGLFRPPGLIVAGGRALVVFGRDPHHRGIARALEDARRRSEEIGWISGQPALDAALATIADGAS